MKYLILFTCLIISDLVGAADYPLAQTSCGGFPQAKIGTSEGVCAGVVSQAGLGAQWLKPRRIVQVPSTQKFIITDMGGWKRGRGVVWLLDSAVKPAKLTALISDLKLPHGLELGPDGLFYVGETDRIFRFRLRDNKAVEVETIIRGLPDFDSHNHPLTHFIFDHQSNLIVNVGAPSDQCQEDKEKVFCSAINSNNSTHAAVRRYTYNALLKSWSPHYEVVASGLRNSMALASHSSGTLLQAENSIDLPELEQPFEEINRIDTGGFFGWPYCYDNNKVNQLWLSQGRKICAAPSKHKQPWVLMPAHAAPLDMRYYTGNMFPELKGQLLISWHGYRETGHRLVSYAVDEEGLPLRSDNAHYLIDSEKQGNNNGVFTRRPFPAVVNTAQAKEIISQMNEISGIRPMGRPAGMTIAEDGAIWLLDDVNKSLLRLVSGAPYQAVIDSSGNPEKIQVKSSKVAKVFLSRCQQCHNLPTSAQAMEIPASWLQKKSGLSLFEERVFHSPMRPMPPDSPLTMEEKAILRQWLSSM